MPGIIVFGRRWSVGSDDFILPALFLLILHISWVIGLAVIFGVIKFDREVACSRDLHDHILGYLVILSLCLVLEAVIACVSLRGGILESGPRDSMQYLLYARLVVLLGEVSWLVVGMVWFIRHYSTCHPIAAKKAVLGVVVCNWVVMLSVLISLWCTFDSAGRKWVKMKKYQESLTEIRRANHRLSGSTRRNWRQRSRVIKGFFLQKLRRKAFRAYEESWDRRLQFLCCCVARKGRNRNSLAEIAQLLTEFFRDLDVVPSDVIAGLVLLRQSQKKGMRLTVELGSNDVYQYLSGVPITPHTHFLQLSDPDVMADYQKLIHYMRFALAAYGWPGYFKANPGTWICRLTPFLSCCCCMKRSNPSVSDDNCCLCNFAALRRISKLQVFDVVYATYHVDIGETPFFVALDHCHKKVVVCVRGTMSLQDVLTDLKAEPEVLPLTPPNEEWLGHKGMVQAALYIKKELDSKQIISKAMNEAEEKTSEKYDLVMVGHSLGAGTAAILAILLRPDYPTLHCYAYAPPGGLLSLTCVEETKSYITSVVVGKDCVPRIGLPQMELLRTDIINMIKESSEPKWKIISSAMSCCLGKDDKVTSDDHVSRRDVTAHPSDAHIGLSATAPLYPPGTIIHVVRTHPRQDKGSLCCRNTQPVYQAVWASNADFDEVLISPTMINDHMPDSVLDALERVLVKVGPPKPVRTLTEAERKVLLSHDSLSSNHSTPRKDSGEASFNWCSASNTHSSATNDYSMAEPHWEDIALHSSSGNTVHDLREADTISEHSDEDLGLEMSIRKQLALSLPEYKLVAAPLASPEGLSASSSLAQIVLAGDGKVYRLPPSISDLETIAQSPEHGLQNDMGNQRGSQTCVPNNQHSVNNNETAHLCTSNTDSNLNSTNEKDRCEKDARNFNIDAIVTVSEMPPQQNLTSKINSLTDATGAGKPKNSLTIMNQNVNFCRHSPDESTQYEYGHPNFHYSAAGTGYQPPINSFKSSSIRPAVPAFIHSDGVKNKPPMRHCTSAGTLLQPAVAHIRRSPEMTDIAYLEDKTMVFEGTQIKEEMSFDIKQDLQEGHTTSTPGAKIFDFPSIETEIV